MKIAGRKIKYTVRLKLSVTILIIIAALLVLMNSYPIRVSRDMVFASKQSTLLSQANVVSSSLSVFEELTEENVKQVMDLLNIMPLNRVLITDSSGKVLYDTSLVDSAVGRYALISEINLALSSKEVFYSSFEENAFMSRGAIPVSSGGRIIGAVYLYEYDEAQGDLLNGIKRNLRSVSFGVGALAIVLIFTFTTNLNRRLKQLLIAVGAVREGKYEYRTEIRGRDEIAELGQAFNAMTDRLQSTEELRRRFVSDASHELKTPLASIRLLSDSIVQNKNIDSETMREFVSDIGNESERLQRLTDKLLKLTRLDNSAESALGPVNLKAVAENTLHLLRPLAQAKGVSLEYTLRDDCVIWANGDDMYQVIFNLVENGIKYNVEKGFVRLLLFRSDGQVNMMVDDSGIGIPEEDMPHIFSRFYRVDKARSREAGGSGLGLSIVHDAIVSHGGSVTVQKREPQGTRFRVCFPIYEAGKEGGTQ